LKFFFIFFEQILFSGVNDIRRIKKQYFCSETFKMRRHTMKKTLSIFLAAALLMSFSFSQASAGPRNNHTLETVVIGAGVALLGAALIHEAGHDNKRKVYTHNGYNSRGASPCLGKNQKHGVYSRDHHQRRHRHHAENWKAFNKTRSQGNWINEKIWVSPIYEKRWVPGHMNKRNRWIRGRHELVMVQQGHWEKRRVWSRSDR